MAYSPKLFSFSFLVALACSLAAVHAAREGQHYFAKASPTTITASTFQLDGATYDYNPTTTTNEPTLVATRSKATTNPTAGTKDLYSLTADEVANYYSINKINNENNMAAAAASQEDNNVHYYDGYRFGTGSKKSGNERKTQQMGMSDTRFVGNGKYFYNINKDKARNVNSVNAGNTKAVYNQQQTYDPTMTTQRRLCHSNEAVGLDSDGDSYE